VKKRSHVNPCEALETRQLLTYTVVGTPGNDVFQVQPGSGYTITLNGVQVITAGDVNVVLTGLGGNDVFVLNSVPYGSITVRGGAGNDNVEVGTGMLYDQLLGQVYIEELAGEGTDSFFAYDQLDTAQPDHIIRVRDNLLTGSIPSKGVHYDDNVELKSLLCSNAADTVYVESPPLGMTINLGGGNDTVRYGSLTAHDLPDFMKPATLNGGSGVDSVLFDDAGGPALELRDYFITPTAIENQTMTGVEDAEIIVRINGSQANTVRMSGRGSTDGLLNDITLSGNHAHIAIGTEAAPVDFSEMSVSLDAKINLGFVTIYDTKDAILSSPWDIFTTSAGQVLGRSFSTLLLRDSADADVSLHGGPTNDQFSVSRCAPGSSIYVYGGGGDDSVYTGNANFQDNDLDDIFLGFLFRFHGGDGQDFFDLDDSADEIGDGDEIYRLRGDALDKGAGEMIQWGSAGGFDDDVEVVRLVTGNEDNTIYFSGPPRFGDRISYEIDAGGGNDYITNYTFANGGDLSWSYHDATIVGGAGTDTLAIDDVASGSQSRSYHFDAGYRMNSASDITFDGSMEVMSLEANDHGSAIRVDRKPPNMQLTVNGRGGNDSFTVGGGDIDSNGFSLSNTTLSGGVGEGDSMRFDDRLDTDPGNETESYLLTALASVNKLGKGTFGVNYTTVESLTLDVANGTLGAASIINLRSFSWLITAVTVNGGSNAFNTVNIGSIGIAGSGNIDTLVGPVFNVTLAGGSDTVNLYNQNSTFTNVYELKTSQLVRKLGQSPEFVVNHTGIEEFNLRAGTNYDYFYPYGSAPGTGMIVYGNGGDDVFWIDNTWGALAGTAIFIGGPGIDHMISATSSPTPHTGTVTDTGVAVNSSPFQSYYETERLTANFGTGAATVNVKSLSVPTEMSANGSNTAVNIGDGNIQANIRATLNLNLGFAANTVITFDDRLDAGNDSYFFNPDLTFYKTDGITAVATPLISGGAVFNNATQTLLANNGNNTIVCNTIVQNLRIFANGGNDNINVARGIVAVDTGTETGSNPNVGDNVNVNSDFFTAGDLPATARLLVSDRIANVAVQPRGTLQIPTGVAMDVSGDLTFSGVIDVAGGSLLKRAAATGPTLAQLRAALIAGRNGGAWNGTNAAGAINSSLAAASLVSDGVGYGLGSQVGVTTIGPFAIAAGDTLIRHTLNGDANLNQQVNLDDFTALASSFGAAAIWVRGDFDYSSSVDLNDFTALAANFGRSVIADLPRSSDTSETAPAMRIGVFGNRQIIEMQDDHSVVELLSDSRVETLLS